MTYELGTEEILGLLSESDERPGSRETAAIVLACGDRRLSFRPMSKQELLEVYERRLRFGRLDKIAGGREFVEALRSAPDDEVLMLSIESPVGTAGLWITQDRTSLIGALAFLADRQGHDDVLR